jgi:hypothetical protein
MSENVIQLTTTTTTAGTFYEVTVPNGLGGYVSRKITFEQLRDAVNAVGEANKGYFPNEAALVSAYTVGENGWFAIVGSTDTVWIWDVDTDEWVDTTNSGVVISVNGLTGAITLTATDIDFSSSEGIAADNVGDAIDELKIYVDATVSGSAGGIFLTEVRAGTITAAGGEEEFDFKNLSEVLTPFIDDDYILNVIDKNGIGFDYVSQSASGFVINAYTAGQFEYQAVRIPTTEGAFTGGTVTSVAITGSDGIEADSGSPITTTGTIVLGINASALRTHLNVSNGAEVNVNADWNSETGDSQILNKPDLSVYELLTNKATDLTSPDDTKYPTTLAVSTAISGSVGTSTDINLIPVPVSIVVGTPDTITLDCDSKYQKIFSTDEISDDFTLSLSNATNIRLISYHFRITGSVIITFGGSLNWVSDDTDWDETGKTYTFDGTTDSMFEISIMKITHDSTDYYKIKFSGEQL